MSMTARIAMISVRTLLLLASIIGFALPSAVDAQVVRDAYLQQLTSNSVTVMFRTEVGIVSEPFVEFGTSPGAFDTIVTGYSATPPSGMGARDKAVQITGLSPQTTYYYRFGTAVDGVLGGGTETHRFTTAAPVGSTAKFSAWVLGDSGTGEPHQRAVRDAFEVELDGETLDLFLHVGDIAYEDGTDAEYTQNFFTQYAGILNRTPFWPTIGNHDADSANSMNQTGPYFEAFRLPTSGQLGGVASGTEAYYSFDHHNVHFIVIDSAEGDLYPPSVMLDWVVADLSNTLADWVVAIFHHPPYSAGSHNSDNGFDSGGRLVLAREFLVPLLEAGGVDLILGGHSHGYERSRLISGVHGYGAAPHFATPDAATLLADGRILQTGDGNPYGDGAYTKPAGGPAAGEVVVVAGHGGRQVSGTGGHPVMAIDEFEVGSTLLHVDGDLLWIENLRADGSVTDQVAISKGTRIHRVFETIEGCGSIERSIDRPLYATGETITLHPDPAIGWEFAAWSEPLPPGASIAGSALTFPISTDIAVTARFVRSALEGFSAYNDLAWVAGQAAEDITRITSPNGGSGLPSSGVLVDRETGLSTGVTLTVTGGVYDGSSHALSESGAPAIETEAWAAFHYHLNPHGSISFLDAPSPAGDLVLALSGLAPDQRYELIFYGNRNDEGWYRATEVELIGAASFVNASSRSQANPDPSSGGGLFRGPDDATTRLPAENTAGYLARFIDIDAGADGEVSLVLRSDGEVLGNGGKYANALGLIATPAPLLTSYLRGDADGTGVVDIGDAVRAIGVIFGLDSALCLDAIDADGNLALEIADPIFLLGYLFSGGLAPAAPWPVCGVVPGLGCDSAPGCP